jgi:hypothetical protein
LKNTNILVKKHQSYGILLLALLFSGTVSAKLNQFVGASAQFGEWSLMPSQSKYATSLGMAGGLGVHYELQANNGFHPEQFLFNIGLTVTGGKTTFNRKSNYLVIHPSYDLQEDLFDYVYDVRDRTDGYTTMALQLPVMVGMQYGRFYFLGGLKLYANMMTRAYSTATLTTYGRYMEWGEFRHMPEYQFFDDVPFKANIKTNLNIDLDASLEIGARLGIINYAEGFDVPKRTVEYRIAVFADYGLLDVHSDRKKNVFDVPDYDTNPASPTYIYNKRTMIDLLAMNDIMSTKGFARRVNNLVVGVKFTVLFQLPKRHDCVICHDGYHSTVRSNGGRRGGVKYEE